MRPTILFSLLALALAGLLVYAGAHRPPPTLAYPPEREPMVLPTNYRETFVVYAQVDRSDAITRKIYISPAAVAAARSGQPFPEHTQIVIEAYDAARDGQGKLLRDANGHLVPGALQPAIHVAELRSTWLIEDLASSAQLGGWNFASFDEASGATTSEALADCFSCHNGAYRSSFLFTRSVLQDYAQSGDEQYRTCPLPGRQPCGF